MIKKFQEFLLEEFKVGQTGILDMTAYLEGMSKGLSDKLFFLNMVDLDILIDFGSADGILLDYISKTKPNLKLIGYDIDEHMIEISRKKYPHITFESSWDIIEEFINEHKEKNIGILLSSVIHEVYSYSTSKVINYFWNNQVFNKNIDYVIIRDMIPSTSFEKMNITDIKKIKEKSNKRYLNEFESIWGDIGTNFRTALHWLLKYRYLANWDREKNENYLPITIERLKERWIPSNWKIQYEKHYTYDFIKQVVLRDFDVILEEPTHLKMIIKNNAH